jgi:hypothetical protein
MTDLDNAIALLNRALKSQTHDGIQDVDAVDDALRILQGIVRGPPLTFPIPMHPSGQNHACKYSDICSGFDEHKCAGCKV